ncbi:zona pellucida glycoprotein d [Thalassophryne amazonica]|uniref:zona pellucida glycoprotein d n=1 Tax=Thalassophryne amazonica TaxID=390379 RepID=UPI001471B6DC|nr:zona pellucida glycoprotein d [Thalassophryne amazonica]
MCGKDYIAIRVLEDFFKYYGVPLESLHLPNNSCRAQREVIDGIPYYMSRISKDKYLSCGGQPLKKNLTHISYSLSLQSDPQEINKTIIRQPIIKMEYTCIYPYVRTVSLPFPVIPVSSETVMRVEEHDVTIQMQLYTDYTYTESYTATPTIALGDKVYVEVTEPADFFLVRLNDCWATQSSKPTDTDGLVHYLIRNGCTSDHSVTFNVTSGTSTNGESSTVRYNFNMFRFTVKPHDVYLHCTVQLCDPDDNASCKPICNSISKRAAIMVDQTQGLLSYGPIRVEMPQKPQSSKALKCSF